ncbi:MAG: hypothetical protein VYB54_06905 [Pseudomonadota bacterium]|nr:hypothetical protein [Pseudomonadota bacterium]
MLAALSLPALAEQDEAMNGAACADARFVLNVCWEVSVTDCDEARVLRNQACGAIMSVAPVAAAPAAAIPPGVTVPKGITARPGMSIPAAPADGERTTQATTVALPAAPEPHGFDVDAENRAQIRRVPGLLLDRRSVSAAAAGPASACADGSRATMHLVWNSRGELTGRSECS